MTTRLEQIDALEKKVTGKLPNHLDFNSDQRIWHLHLTTVERWLIADALLLLYGAEHRAATKSDVKSTREEEMVFGHAKIIRDRLSIRLNDKLCGMRDGYDDSVTGFNEAWNVMRKLFDDIEAGK